MNIAVMKSFSTEELSLLLDDCGRHLAEAYQNTLKKEYWYQSELAFRAASYLNYLIQKQSDTGWVH